MLTPKQILIAVSLIAALVAVLVWRGCRDSEDAGRIAQLHTDIRRDDSTRNTESRAMDSTGRVLTAAIDTVRKVDTVVQRAIVHSANIDTILMSSAPETVKVTELVRVVDTLRTALVAEQRACLELTNSCQAFRDTAKTEKAAADRQISDLNTALALSEKRARHWGLGCSAGYGVARGSVGRVALEPAGACGLTWRF